MTSDHDAVDALIKEQVSLKGYNTLSIDVSAAYFATVTSFDELTEAVDFAKAKGLGIFTIGEGSNLVLTADISALVLKIDFKAIEPLDMECQTGIQRIRVGAGEVWDHFVAYTLEHNWYGLENLSLIPGTVGASPVQNIGAYGIEVSDVIAWVECFDTETGREIRLNSNECQFGYRDSLFKRSNTQHHGYNRYVITHVVFDLQRQFNPNVDYAAFEQFLDNKDKASLNASQVRQAVIDIRSAKLPDPSLLANAGSFFKNPVICGKKAHKIRERYKSIPNYPAPDKNGEPQVKIAAGWLIEQAGWKGRCLGPVGMHDKQALVLVNHGGATADDVIGLSKAVVADVERQFGITLEAEPVHFPQGVSMLTR